MQIISTDVLDVVRIVDDSVEGGSRLINACDLSDDDQVVEEIAKGGRRTKKVADQAPAEAVPEAAPEATPAPAEAQAPAAEPEA